MSHHERFGEELSSASFAPSDCALWRGFPHSEICGLRGELKPGWRIVGWARNKALPRQRDDADLPPGEIWVGVKYEHDDGSTYWFHHIADESEISTEPPKDDTP